MDKVEGKHSSRILQSWRGGDYHSAGLTLSFVVEIAGFLSGPSKGNQFHLYLLKTGNNLSTFKRGSTFREA
jgi:hypothetical protein